MRTIIMHAVALAAALGIARVAAAHCEVPCGIYADQRRFEQMLEDCDTIAKAGLAPEDDDDVTLAAVERRHILRVLDMEGGNKSAAARRLGVSRKTLERKCQAWGVVN